MIEGFTAIVAEAGPGTAAIWLAASLVANAWLAALLLWGAWRRLRHNRDNVNCGRCGKEIDEDAAEVCWWCTDWLCYDCWDRYGHCGHPEAEAMNEYARSVPRPELTDEEKRGALCEHAKAVKARYLESDLPWLRVDIMSE